MFASRLRCQGLVRDRRLDPEAVGLYLAAQVERGEVELSVATLERRLSGIAWRYRHDARASRSTSGDLAADRDGCAGPAFAVATLALPCRRPPSSPTSF